MRKIKFEDIYGNQYSFLAKDVTRIPISVKDVTSIPISVKEELLDLIKEKGKDWRRVKVKFEDINGNQYSFYAKDIEQGFYPVPNVPKIGYPEPIICLDTPVGVVTVYESTWMKIKGKKQKLKKMKDAMQLPYKASKYFLIGIAWLAILAMAICLIEIYITCCTRIIATTWETSKICSVFVTLLFISITIVLLHLLREEIARQIKTRNTWQKKIMLIKTKFINWRQKKSKK